METSPPRHPCPYPFVTTEQSDATRAAGESVISIKYVLSRIRWDPEFGRGRFVVGYEDHIAGGIVRVPFSEIRIESGDRSSFVLADDQGGERTIPYHRVREVLRDGQVIWHRAP